MSPKKRVCPILHAIRGFRLVTADLQRLTLFYQALGFAKGLESSISGDEMALLGLCGKGARVSLTLGPSCLELDCYERPGERYPADVKANDIIFQHLALVTTDAPTAWTSAQIAGATAIGSDGPVKLPASSGCVTAVKFRDPDGHPLELLEFVAGSNPAWPGVGMRGIDHSAIVAADVDASRAFYEALGLKEGRCTVNQGPAQVALDGLGNVRVEVVPLDPEQTPPHVELLCYRHPTGAASDFPAVNDIAATRIVWCADRDALLRDPDGHLHQLVARRVRPARLIRRS